MKTLSKYELFCFSTVILLIGCNKNTSLSMASGNDKLAGAVVKTGKGQVSTHGASLKPEVSPAQGEQVSFGQRLLEGQKAMAYEICEKEFLPHVKALHEVTTVGIDQLASDIQVQFDEVGDKVDAQFASQQADTAYLLNKFCQLGIKSDEQDKKIDEQDKKIRDMQLSLSSMPLEARVAVEPSSYLGKVYTKRSRTKDMSSRQSVQEVKSRRATELEEQERRVMEQLKGTGIV